MYKSDRTSNRKYNDKYIPIQVITIASLYVIGHLLCIISEYSKITNIDNDYYNLQLWMTLLIHGTSVVFIVVDAFRLIKLLNLVETLAKDIFLCAMQNESFMEAELY